MSPFYYECPHFIAILLYYECPHFIAFYCSILSPKQMNRLIKIILVLLLAIPILYGENEPIVIYPAPLLEMDFLDASAVSVSQEKKIAFLWINYECPHFSSRVAS